MGGWLPTWAAGQLCLKVSDFGPASTVLGIFRGQHAAVSALGVAGDRGSCSQQPLPGSDYVSTGGSGLFYLPDPDGSAERIPLATSGTGPGATGGIALIKTFHIQLLPDLGQALNLLIPGWFPRPQPLSSSFLLGLSDCVL